MANIGETKTQQTLLVVAQDLTNVEAKGPLNASQKLIPREQVTDSQGARPSILNSDAAKFAQKACGFSMIGLGLVGIAVLSPITIPMGLLGAGVGFALGKAIGHEKAGMLAGSALGTLLFSGIAFAGAKLVENARMSNDGKLKEKEGLQTTPSASAAKEKEIEKLQSSIGRLEEMCRLKQDTIDKGLGHGRNETDLQRVQGDLKSFQTALTEKRAQLEELQKNPTAVASETKVSEAKMEAPAKKLTLNEAEAKFQKRIDFFRNMSREGNNTENEIQEKKVQLTAELKGKEFGKEFKKSALGQLKEFDGDFAKGQITKSENLNKAFATMMEKNDISIEFFQFIKDLPKNPEMHAKIADTTETIKEIKGLQEKAKATLKDEIMDVTAKTVSIFSDRGHLRSDAQFFILDDLKEILSSGKTPDQKKEVNSSIDVIKRHLTHQLAEGKVAPTKDEVVQAYKTIKEFAEGVVNPGVNIDNVSKDVHSDELGAVVGAEIDRLMEEAEVSQPKPVNEPKAPSFQEKISEVKSKLAEVTKEKQSLKLHIIELEKIEKPSAEELSDLSESQANLIKLIDEDLKLNMDIIGLSRRNETAKYLT